MYFNVLSAAFVLSILLCSEAYAEELKRKINDDRTHNSSYYLRHGGVMNDVGTAHISVIGPDETYVSVTV